MAAASPRLVAGRLSDLGDGTKVTRLLPTRERRTVGPWCFLDSYHLEGIARLPGMQVAPHPHVGIATVTYLLEGEVHHRDSLGGDSIVRPGELSLMTAGAGIVHSERSPVGHGPVLQGIQAWIALTGAGRDVPPAYLHARSLPTTALGGSTCRVLLGSFSGASSPVASPNRCVAAELVAPSHDRTVRLAVPLDPSFEHAIVPVVGTVSLEAVGTGSLRSLAPGELAVLPPGADTCTIETPAGARTVLLGGPPLEEPMVVWWNFVAPTADEILAARARWESGGFGEVPGDGAPRVVAPPLPTGRLRARR